jgi:hypothetical protein
MRLTPRKDICTPSAAATGLAVWRLTIAAVALVGFCLAMLNGTRRWHWLGLYEWGQLTTLLACLVALAGVAAPALRPGEATMGIIRGASCAYVMVTMIGYRFLIGGDYSKPASLLEHLVVPLLVLIDWLFIGRSLTRMRWYWPLVWIAGPAAYVALYIHGAGRYGISPYPILTVGRADFWPAAVALISSFVPLFFLVWGAPRIVVRSSAPQAQPQQV